MKLVLPGLIALCVAGCANGSAIEDGGVRHGGGSSAPGANGPSVVLECVVAAEGALQDCVVLSETPPGRGFGEAALERAHRARLSPETVNPEAHGGSVRFTMRFDPTD